MDDDCDTLIDASDSYFYYTLTNIVSHLTHWLGRGNSESDVNSDGIFNTRDLGIMMSR